MIKLQVKIFLALAFLFLIIVILGVSGSLFIRKLAGESGNIVKDNQMSVRYSVEMLQLLDKIYVSRPEKKVSSELFSEFEKILKAEADNVTEKGEAELVRKLSRAYPEFRNYYYSSRKSEKTEINKETNLTEKNSEMRATLYNIFRLNTEAILRRNQHAQQTAGRVSNYMLFSGLASSLIALILIIYLPRYLVRPIHEIAGKMKKITDSEYNKKLNTGRKDELENLASAFNVMAQRDIAKTDLIATVSHELKTPISSINLALKLLENEKVGSTNEEQKQIIESIRQQSLRLSKMVNELLDYSQAESGNIKLKIEPVAVTDIIDYAAVAMLMIMGEKKITLDTDIEKNLPPVLADIEKTVWVLVNLINNAVRYTPENGLIKISASSSDKFVTVSVIDQGPGMPPEEHERIFSKFVQAGTGNPKGKGLGLAISKEFVLAQGGDIWVESKTGAGSKFSFRLPSA